MKIENKIPSTNNLVKKNRIQSQNHRNSPQLNLRIFFHQITSKKNFDINTILLNTITKYYIILFYDIF